MNQLDLSCVTSWANDGNGYRRPVYISQQCPHCANNTNFQLIPAPIDANANSFSAYSNCSGCAKKTNFFGIFDRDETSVVPYRMKVLYYYPNPQNAYKMPPLPDEVPVTLQRAIEASVNSYNAKIYTATAVTGRRALEGIFKFRVPLEDRGKPLFKLIEQVTTEVDPENPIGKLSHAIRSGGNLGAHFDEENEPDEKMARQIVELLDYLVTYLYVLPEKIRTLEDGVSKKNK